MRALALLGVLVVGLGAGCAASGDPAAVVAEFYTRVADGDGTGACALMTPGAVEAVETRADARCADAVLEGEVGEELLARSAGEVTQVRTAGAQAQVRTAQDVVFLSASGGTWLLAAAACDARDDGPYDCALEAS
jgi:hypothetical protein